MAALGLNSVVPPRGRAVTLQHLKAKLAFPTQMVLMPGKKRLRISAKTVRTWALRQVRLNALAVFWNAEQILCE